jgi:hypothetical protein
MTQYAKFKSRSAWLGTEFGESYARRLFGDAAVDALPRNKKGKYVGKIKASIEWTKCIEGGWVSTGPRALDGTPSGGVERRVGSTLTALLRGNDGKAVATWGDMKYIHMLEGL